MAAPAIKRGGRPKGLPKTGGRQKGTPNAFTADIKTAIANAFRKVGGEDYLVTVAREQPSVFCSLLGKVIPTQVEGTGENGAITVRWMPPS